MPTIFEPSQRMSASQKIYIMAGVPLVARNRKAVERIVRIDPTIATSFLNQRLSRRTTKTAVATAMSIDGSLIANKFSPKMARLPFWSAKYGILMISPCLIKFASRLLAWTTEFISASDRPVGATPGSKVRIRKNATESRI